MLDFTVIEGTNSEVINRHTEMLLSELLLDDAEKEQQLTNLHFESFIGFEVSFYFRFAQ